VKDEAQVKKDDDDDDEGTMKETWLVRKASSYSRSAQR
jgi:hypothetical protein